MAILSHSRFLVTLALVQISHVLLLPANEELLKKDVPDLNAIALNNVDKDQVPLSNEQDQENKKLNPLEQIIPNVIAKHLPPDSNISNQQQQQVDGPNFDKVLNEPQNLSAPLPLAKVLLNARNITGEIQVKDPKLGVGDHGSLPQQPFRELIDNNAQLLNQPNQVDKPIEPEPAKTDTNAKPLDAVERKIVEERVPNLPDLQEKKLDQHLQPEPNKDMPILEESLRDNELKDPLQVDVNVRSRNIFPFEAVNNDESNLHVQNEIQSISLNYVFIIICSLLFLLLCAWKPLCHALCAFMGVGAKPFSASNWRKGLYRPLDSEKA